ncbi:GAF domain-containing protein [Leptospira kemamanensis]|uniref:GAF domain-containing protein n=1 Tax=Leptospira kemamanensis TaxID=2484942 RepID=A0A4R9JSH0_9LEPT|nr:GAF domain-containing SpoIIE family protein phosphatase [Leptospira kemamanensis]TGL55021.1 GAF domain-containing protein [Leptospira kemamanensis]
MVDFKVSKRMLVNFRGQNKVVGGLTDKDKIAILLYISKEFANLDREDQLFSKVILICQEIFESDNTTLRLWDGEFLVPVKFVKETEPPRRNLKSGEGYSGTVFESREPMLVNDLSRSAHYFDEGEKTKSVMCVPIMQKEEILGTLAVESERENFYILDDLEILEALTSQLALALYGVRLIEGLVTARAREAAILNQLEWDLKMGRNVQSQILPQDLSAWNGIYFASHYEPMAEVSGDLVDIVRQGHSLTAINIDVSGHGIPAALVTMAIHHQFRRSVMAGLGLTEIMEELGEKLREQLPESTYFTAFMVRIFSDYTFGYVNAGHQRMLHYKASDDTFIQYDTKGVPLGILPVRKIDYEEKQGKLEPGDFLLLISDGFSEQRNHLKDEVGVERIQTWLHDEREKLVIEGRGKVDLKKLSNAFIKRFRAYQGEVPNGDDLSFLFLYCGDSIPEASHYIQLAKQSNSKMKTEEAYAQALKAFSIDSSLKEILVFLGKMYYRDGKYKEAIRYLEEYLRTSGDNTAASHFTMGRAYYKAGMISEAKRALKMALSSDHSFAKASILLAQCYLKENAKPKAIKVLQQGVKNTPQSLELKSSLLRLESHTQKAI